MALVESHNCSWEASGCAIRSSLVCFSYDFRAASKIVWKREEAVDVEAVWDMGAVKESKMILVRVETRRMNPAYMYLL